MVDQFIELVIIWVMAAHVLLNLVSLAVASLKFSIKVQFLLVVFQNTFRPFDIIIHCLPTDVKVFRNLAQRIVIPVVQL